MRQSTVSRSQLKEEKGEVMLKHSETGTSTAKTLTEVTQGKGGRASFGEKLKYIEAMQLRVFQITAMENLDHPLLLCSTAPPTDVTHHTKSDSVPYSYAKTKLQIKHGTTSQTTKEQIVEKTLIYQLEGGAL